MWCRVKVGRFTPDDGLPESKLMEYSYVRYEKCRKSAGLQSD